jgi:succinate dehydrogenase hydrophobic anchor subunit
MNRAVRLTICANMASVARAKSHIDRWLLIGFSGLASVVVVIDLILTLAQILKLTFTRPQTTKAAPDFLACPEPTGT